MANKMLIDATHPEETRVVVLRGNRVEEFDFESAHRKQLRGNIYLAKVTRVEPSLQAAFVDYGGNRHGFLAFSEIHPDYYQIPVADRQALIDEEERAQRAADDEVDRRSRRGRGRDRHAAAHRDDDTLRSELADTPAGDEATGDQAAGSAEGESAEGVSAEATESHDVADGGTAAADLLPPVSPESTPDMTEPEQHEPAAAELTSGDMPAPDSGEAETTEVTHAAPDADEQNNGAHTSAEGDNGGENGTENGGDEEAEIVESVGGADAMEEVPDRAPRYRRQYKIQEVIKRRQVMLVQVVKEERGTKGAALTTYLSLAGRYSVLMPNTARGGGISRKITNSEDRARLKEAAADLEVPEGMGVILRTAGASRTKIEIKRDFEYLLRLWETVRDLTLKSTAPKLVYEEGSLVKRSIRDLYGKDIDEVIVAGSEAYHEAKDFMRMLMPSHAKNVKPYTDTQPLLSRYGVESQLDAMFSPVVQLRSGGYIVLNQAEALVAIDVNSGRATREHHIEDTALKTNLEASDEIAPPAAAARSRRPDRHRFHRHGREAQQPLGRAPAEGMPQARPRPHPGRPHLAFRPPGNVAAAHPHQRAGKLDGEMPVLRRQRPCPLGVVAGAAGAARARRATDARRHPQSHRPHPARRGALRAQPEARAFAQPGRTVCHHHHDRRRCNGDGAAGLRDRARRAGAYGRGGARARRAEPTAAAAPLEEEDDLETDALSRTRSRRRRRRTRTSKRRRPAPYPNTAKADRAGGGGGVDAAGAADAMAATATIAATVSRFRSTTARPSIQPSTPASRSRKATTKPSPETTAANNWASPLRQNAKNAATGPTRIATANGEDAVAVAAAAAGAIVRNAIAMASQVLGMTAPPRHRSTVLVRATSSPHRPRPSLSSRRPSPISTPRRRPRRQRQRQSVRRHRQRSNIPSRRVGDRPYASGHLLPAATMRRRRLRQSPCPLPPNRSSPKSTRPPTNRARPDGGRAVSPAVDATRDAGRAP